MAFIESHQELARHPKTKKLARQLHIPIPFAIGYLHMLWYWCMDFADDGNLGRYENADITDAMLWDGEPDIMIAALLDAGFLDHDEHSGAFLIHDWLDYAGNLIIRRKANAEKQKAWRDRQKTDTKPLPISDVADTLPLRDDVSPLRNGATVPNRTQPYPTTYIAPVVNETLPESPPALAAVASAPPQQTPEAPAKPTRKPKAPDPFWDAIQGYLGFAPSPSLRGSWNAAIRDIKAQEGRPEEIPKRFDLLQKLFPDCPLTAMSLAKWWPQLTGTSVRDAPKKIEEMTLEERRAAKAKRDQDYAEAKRALRAGT